MVEKDIGKINKNDTTDIVVRVDDFGGRTGLTIREFVNSERYTGFTKSGVRILAADFPKFKEMINSISEEDMQVDGDSAPNGRVGGAPTPEKPQAQKGQEQLPDY